MDIRQKTDTLTVGGKSYTITCNFNVLADVQAQYGGNLVAALREATTKPLHTALVFAAAMLNDAADAEGVRYNELRRQVRGVTNMMLTKCLRELEAAGLVLRRDFAETPPRVEYALSETGRSLMPILRKLYRWEARRMRGGE